MKSSILMTLASAVAAVPQAASGSGGKVNGAYCGILSMISGTIPDAKNYAKTDGTYGTGPYKSWYSTDASLPKYTIYQPKAAPATLKMPVLLFGNGGCSGDGLNLLNLKIELASHGIFVLSNGAPNGSGSTQASWFKTSADWIVKNAGKGKYANVDASRISVAGQSCGGTEAYSMAQDPRVSNLLIFNSGAMGGLAGATVKDSAKFTKPVAYLLGGSDDIAYENGERDYKNIPAGIPKLKGNIPAGHGGTYCQAAAGQFGKFGAEWLKWTLRGDATAGQYFTAGGAAKDNWDLVSASLDKIKIPTPLPA